MVVLIEEILGEIFRQIGDISGTSDDSKKKPKNEDSKNDVANFMLSGQKPLEVALKFFGSTNTAILTEEHVELVTDKDESVKFQADDLISIEAIKDVLETSIKKLECKKFNEKHVEFWNALKSLCE
uniref:Uncharacterized protein n=1 Tax=Panagrolaimus davidi TaxID=227884 RepID=A0A914PS70_9BILA